MTKIIKFFHDAEQERQREKEHQVEKLITRDISQIYSQTKTNLLWTGTAVDLLELTHIAWITGEFVDETGRPMTFKHLSAVIFDKFNRRCPNHPHQLLASRNRRKHHHMLPLLHRYIYMMEKMGIRDPMVVDIGAVKEEEEEKAA